MTLESIKTYSYTYATAAILATMTVNTISGSTTKTPYIILDNCSYTISHSISNLIGDEEHTIMCMMLSEKSLAEDWENEDDERWSKFLING